MNYDIIGQCSIRSTASSRRPRCGSGLAATLPRLYRPGPALAEHCQRSSIIITSSKSEALRNTIGKDEPFIDTLNITFWDMIIFLSCFITLTK